MSDLFKLILLFFYPLKPVIRRKPFTQTNTRRKEGALLQRPTDRSRDASSSSSRSLSHQIHSGIYTLLHIVVYDIHTRRYGRRRKKESSTPVHTQTLIQLPCANTSAAEAKPVSRYRKSKDMKVGDLWLVSLQHASTWIFIKARRKNACIVHRLNLSALAQSSPGRKLRDHSFIYGLKTRSIRRRVRNVRLSEEQKQRSKEETEKKIYTSSGAVAATASAAAAGRGYIYTEKRTVSDMTGEMRW